MTILEIEVVPTSVSRIGKRGSKSRPIKLVMASINDKVELMKNLYKLKNAHVEFKTISITDDYTLEERQSIKDMVQKAKTKTENEGAGQYVWRVRGTPKNGLELRRFNVPNQTLQ